MLIFKNYINKVSQTKTAKFLIASIEIIIPATIFHLLFSKYGLNPTDDGFILAYSRRIIEGQIPHLDFISIRPVLSPIVHIPFVLFGGDYTFLLDRFFVWIQWGIIAYLFTEVLFIYSGVKPSNFIKFLIFLIAFMLNANNFPIMAWHTVDGMFFAAIGFFLIVKFRDSNIKYLGYFIAGLSVLCKQNFIFIIPLLLVLFWEDKFIIKIFLMLLPIFVYIIVLIILGVLEEATLQLTSHSKFFNFVYHLFFNYRNIIGFSIGFVILHILKKKNKFINKFYLKIIFILLTISISSLLYLRCYLKNNFILDYSYLIFGIFLGQLFYLFFDYDYNFFRNVYFKIIIFILLLSVVISISLGYPYPILLCGTLVAGQIFNFLKEIYLSNKNIKFIIVSSFLLTFIFFAIIRFTFIYLERPAKYLEYSIDNVIKGTTGIYTNYNMFEYANELNEIISELEQKGQKFAILPDFTAYWVKSEYVNLLPIDWVQGTELKSPYLKDKVFKSILEDKDRLYIVSNFSTPRISEGLYEPYWNSIFLYNFLKDNLIQVKKLKYFTIYGY